MISSCFSNVLVLLVFLHLHFLSPISYYDVLYMFVTVLSLFSWATHCVIIVTCGFSPPLYKLNSKVFKSKL